jgi:hypothetical protein
MYFSQMSIGSSMSRPGTVLTLPPSQSGGE